MVFSSFLQFIFQKEISPLSKHPLTYVTQARGVSILGILKAAALLSSGAGTSRRRQECQPVDKIVVPWECGDGSPALVKSRAGRGSPAEPQPLAACSRRMGPQLCPLGQPRATSATPRPSQASLAFSLGKEMGQGLAPPHSRWGFCTPGSDMLCDASVICRHSPCAWPVATWSLSLWAGDPGALISGRD